ncbi:DUF1853 family protein [Chromobacterium phragmitis]|uniref:DUF1853 family protein n=1 Tax=Chromobacterium phragmitis TaxID=2202141 RepID=UPI001F2B90D1|nr:DUF1853 family protein [Chromobacterium phragmitis]
MRRLALGLAPAWLEAECSYGEDALRARLSDAQTPQWVAELQPDGGGRWRGVARGFATAPGWPEPERLGILLRRIART